ncbi:hypothetical protein DY000_02032538 [Brassica cretica]|uniref:Uncharacterized protein n=1 Tax=Brassica cretica TaxID=69181 RepID=A0ABQ7DGR6_BRACR|nr:hypothetical protein DY000_02032538 [Brassica cretica]
MTNDNNTPIATTDVIQTPLNAALTDATGVTTAATNITASTAAATTSTILLAGNAADETTRRSLFGAGLYQTGSKPNGLVNEEMRTCPTSCVTREREMYIYAFMLSWVNQLQIGEGSPRARAAAVWPARFGSVWAWAWAWA